MIGGVSTSAHSLSQIGCDLIGSLLQYEVMTRLLEQAIDKVKEFSSEDQDAMAAIILAELEHADCDREIERDFKAGRFDKLIKKMREDIAAGKSQPL